MWIGVLDVDRKQIFICFVFINWLVFSSPSIGWILGDGIKK